MSGMAAWWGPPSPENIGCPLSFVRLSLVRSAPMALRLPHEAEPDEEPDRTSTVIGLLAAVTSVGMVVGSIGPWVQAATVTVHGLDGFGFFATLAALTALSLHLLYVGRHRRSLLIGALVAAVVNTAVAAFVCALVWTLSGVGTLLAWVLARGAHEGSFSDGDVVSVAWGLPLLAVCSILVAFFSLLLMAGGTRAPRTAGRRRCIRRFRGSEDPHLYPELEPSIEHPRWR